MTPAEIDHYKQFGYVVLQQVVDSAALDRLEAAFVKTFERHIWGDMTPPQMLIGMHTPRFAEWLKNFGGAAHLYEAMREDQWLTKVFPVEPSLMRHVPDMIGKSVNVQAPRFRMDQPHDTRFVAHWHQDHAYVGGSVETVTAWVPLQDVPWEMGPLLIVPTSHNLGPLPHDRQLGDRKVPSPFFIPPSNPVTAAPLAIRMMPMNRGDVLFFHSLLLHSGQVNFSDRVRYSVQIRYEPL